MRPTLQFMLVFIIGIAWNFSNCKYCRTFRKCAKLQQTQLDNLQKYHIGKYQLSGKFDNETVYIVQ